MTDLCGLPKNFTMEVIHLRWTTSTQSWQKQP